MITNERHEANILAHDLVNQAIQELVERAEKGVNRDLALAIANIKYQVQQRFDQELSKEH